MILKILLMTMAIKASYAWPITPLEGYLQMNTEYWYLKCGDVITIEQQITTILNISFNNNGPIPENCTIELRISLKDNGLEDFGIRALGDIDMVGPSIRDNNDMSCDQTYLSLADEDTLDDETGHIERFCGPQHRIAFNTHQDVLVLKLSIGETDVHGHGFHISVEPHYMCGGKITTDTCITTPDYPEPYPNDFNCFWLAQGGPDKVISITCSEFDLPPPKKGRCPDNLHIQGADVNKNMCGHTMENRIITVSGMFTVLDFRSNEKYNLQRGFNCCIKIEPKRKDFLLAKFFQ